MKKREVVEYIAFDGKVFNDASACKEYEKSHEFREIAEQKLIEAAAKISNILFDNDMHLEVSENYGNEILLCFNGHFDDLCFEIKTTRGLFCRRSKQELWW